MDQVVRVKHTLWCFEWLHLDATKCLSHGRCDTFFHIPKLKWTMTFENLVVTEGRNTLLNRCFDAAASDVNWYVGLIGAGTGTVSITSGQNSVTGSSTNFAAADVGSSIIIVGAGSGGADLITTVNTVSSATSLTVTNNAGTTVSGAAYAIEPRPTDVMNNKSFNESTIYSNATRPQWVKNGSASDGQMSNSANKAQFNINASGRVFGSFLSSNNTKGGTSGLLFGGDVDTTNGSRQVLNGDTVNVQIDISVTAT